MTRRSPNTPLVVANWKMQLGIEESIERFTALKLKVKAIHGRYDVVVCPSFIALGGMKKLLRGTTMKLGAQDLFWDDRGAFTGEVSPLNIAEAGAEYVIIGHSERRQYFNETDGMIARKVISALGHGLTPILCVGETAHERNEQRHEIVVRRQIHEALRTAPPPLGQNRLYIAYEPVWAIGTGEPAGVEAAVSMYNVIKQTLIDMYSLDLMERSFRILYGGSVDAGNVAHYVGPSSYHGALVGGASLDPEKFSFLITNIAKTFTTSRL
jgi:triosephosphate isomerase